MGQTVEILLIEDNPLFVKLTQSMLEDAKTTSFVLHCADNLAAGIERLQAGGIDAVLLDLTLPDSSGIDTFARLHMAAENVPTVIYTSLDDESVSLAALNQGAADYLVKSEVNANWLARSLVYAIQRGRAQRTPHAAAASDRAATTMTPQPSATTDDGWVVNVADKRLVNAISLEELQNCLLQLLGRADCQEVCIDMSIVDYIGNAGLSMLLLVHKRTTAAKKRLVLSGLNDQVFEQFSSRRFDKFFDLRRV